MHKRSKSNQSEQKVGILLREVIVIELPFLLPLLVQQTLTHLQNFWFSITFSVKAELIASSVCLLWYAHYLHIYSYFKSRASYENEDELNMEAGA